MPGAIRDALLGNGDDDPSSVFLVNRERARDGRVEPTLATRILDNCSGRVQLRPEHGELREPPAPEAIASLPAEIREGLWTFPREEGEDGGMVVDGVLQLDEVVFDDKPEILLNDRPEESGSRSRPIDQLSPGQRCSAILPILLLNGDTPLIIDQPEDNLDNRLIRQVIINILAAIKLKRQVIIATHNPNLQSLVMSNRRLSFRPSRRSSPSSAQPAISTPCRLSQI